MNLNLSNHTSIQIKGIMKVTAHNGNTTRTVDLENALNVLNLRNLISVAKIIDMGTTLYSQRKRKKEYRWNTIVVANRKENLYFENQTRNRPYRKNI